MHLRYAILLSMDIESYNKGREDEKRRIKEKIDKMIDKELPSVDFLFSMGHPGAKEKVKEIIRNKLKDL